VLEYRKAAGRFESGIVGSGLIIYRVNPSLNGNSQGPPDEVYVYRQNGTSRSDGNVNNATFSSSVGRTEFGDNTNPSDFLSNGNAGGIRISNVGPIGESITFTVGTGGALNPPQELTASLDGRNANLTWKKPAPGSGTLAGYKVYRNQAAISTINNPATLAFSDPGLADGTYQYHVTARYTTPAGESGPSNTVTVSVSSEARPDLIVTGPSVDPANVEPGGKVNLSCRLENMGTAQAGSSLLRIYLSTDETFDSGDRQLASGSMDPLDPGAAHDVTGDNISIPANTNIGSWYVLFLADADGTVNESIENNNQASAALTVGNPALNPPRNLNALVSSLTVKLTWQEPEPGGGTLAGYNIYRNNNKIATINNPATAEYTDSGLALGAYTYYLTAFYSTPAGESSHSNEVTVTLANDLKPDLTVQDLIVTPAEVSPGGSIDISCSILNIGAAAAGGNEVRLYLSQDLIQDDNDVYLAYGTIDAIEAGAKITVSGADIALPGVLASGTWYALLIVDAANAIAETNEDNNQASTPVKVQGLAPDLLITNMVLFPAIITPTSNVRITFNVANNGPVQASPVKTTFYLSTDEILDPSDAKMCDVSTRFLGSRVNTLMYSGFVMSYHYLPGQYFLIGMVDKEGVVAESDEANNVFVKAITVAGTTGIDTQMPGAGLRIYPVPANDRLTVEFPALPGDWVVITVTDIIGRELYREERVAAAMNLIKYDTGNWPPGTGMVRIQLKNRLLYGRYVIE
jgi:subtilase family serine protease